MQKSQLLEEGTKKCVHIARIISECDTLVNEYVLGMNPPIHLKIPNMLKFQHDRPLSGISTDREIYAGTLRPRILDSRERQYIPLELLTFGIMLDSTCEFNARFPPSDKGVMFANSGVNNRRPIIAGGETPKSVIHEVLKKLPVVQSACICLAPPQRVPTSRKDDNNLTASHQADGVTW